MRILPIIEKKKAGQALTDEEIAFVVTGAAKGTLPDYQLAALMMAICFRGMTRKESIALALAMAHSGDSIDLSGISGIPVDKHSTGGVGDTTTLVLAPLVAACGVPVAKMSGSGLGHTGGTLDKLQSIPGVRVEMTREQFISQVESIGIAVCSQSANLAPADKTLYALRNATATVDSLPLIASSIMSKKLVSGARALVLDVKAGNGALMKTLEDAKALGRIMVDIGIGAGLQAVALVTDMNQPLGMNVGNALEVEEAIDILSGRTKGALRDVSIRLGGHMLHLAGATLDPEAGEAMLCRALESGQGLEKLRQMIGRQGGDPRVCDDTTLLPKAKVILPVRFEQSGYVASMDTTGLGVASQMLGAGRLAKEDVIDPSVGFVMKARIGDNAQKGQPLAIVHANSEADAQTAAKRIRDCVKVSQAPVESPRLVYALITKDGIQEIN